jgi:hypothetical protein
MLKHPSANTVEMRKIAAIAVEAVATVSRLTGQSAKVRAIARRVIAVSALDRWTNRSEEEIQARMRKRLVGVLSAAVLVVGCGATDDYANDERPPAPRDISVVVDNERVLVSPDRIGAGPVVLLIANESDRSHDLVLAPPEGSSSACVDADASSGPINPRGTARIALDLVEGDCVVGVRGRRGPRSARLTVGRERPSAQADLLSP